MQADCTLSRNIMLTCYDAYPGWVQLSALYDQFMDQSEDSTLYHVPLPKKHNCVEFGEQRINEPPSAGPVSHSDQPSHLPAADRFLGKPEEVN